MRSFPSKFEPTKPYEGRLGMPIIQARRLPIRRFASLPKITLPGRGITLVD
jgi:hypothetical protein